MNNKEWIISKTDTHLSEYPCVQHKTTKEKCIAGNHGEIWENGPHSFKCSVFGKLYAKKLAAQLGLPAPEVSQGDEVTFTFGLSNLIPVIKIIQAPKSALLQQGIIERRNLLG